MPSVTKILLKDDKKLPKISIGKIVNEAKMNLPEIVILCVIAHSLHLIGL